MVSVRLASVRSLVDLLQHQGHLLLLSAVDEGRLVLSYELDFGEATAY